MSSPNEDDITLLRSVGIGLDIKVFMESALGKFLLERAECEAVSAFTALKIADPEDAKLIRSLQNTIKVAESFEIWLIEGIDAGKAAEAQYEASRLD